MRALGSWLAAVGMACSGCGAPILMPDGAIAFPEPGVRGAAVVTPNGVVFRDRADIPARVIARSPFEPWRAPLGFILPQSGRFTETSRPTILATRGLVVTLRPSDTRVPSWGGEILLRVDVASPVDAGKAPRGEEVVVVLSASDPTAALGAILGRLSGRDRVTLVDGVDPKHVLSAMPASNRSLILAAAVRRSGVLRTVEGDLVKALSELPASPHPRRVLLLVDESSSPKLDGLRNVVHRRGWASAIVPLAPAPGSAWLDDALPRTEPTTFKNLVLRISGVPAPSHVVEASGGEVSWGLDSDALPLGDIRAGDARAEVLRVSIPGWVPGEPFTLTATVEVDDVAWGPRAFGAELGFTIDDDVERIAESRHGDVIAYASALATLSRLEGAFLGEGVARLGGLRPLAELQASSLARLAHDQNDHAVGEQAEMLGALLRATE